MEKTDALTGLRKRQQIRTANKTVFAWIITASIVLGICVVVSQFFVRELVFRAKILGALGETNSTIEKNIKSYDGLKAEVVKLVANSNLGGLRKGDNSTALQVIIDALPTEENRASLASSMQSEVLGPSGVTINSFSVIDTSTASATATSTSIPSFSFTFTITGNYAQITQAVRNLERSIRPLNIQSIDLQGNDQQLRADITAVTYYQPVKDISLKTGSVKP